MKYKWFYHAATNYMALAVESKFKLPVLHIVDEEYVGENPLITYPLNYLRLWGWEEIGEL